jgi:hypothetical protein
MNLIMILILVIIGILAIFAFPKIFHYFFSFAIVYLTIFINFLFVLLFIPYLVIVIIIRRKKNV